MAVFCVNCFLTKNFMTVSNSTCQVYQTNKPTVKIFICVWKYQIKLRCFFRRFTQIFQYAFDSDVFDVS